ncbi:MAG: C25 family cysteine peptidase [Pirellulales bacterium]
MALPAPPDTLVVCPPEFRPALAAWEKYRRGQGHEILIVDPPHDAADLTATIHRVAQTGHLKYLLLIGDVPGTSVDPVPGKRLSTATNYVSAKINTRWGSEPTIATDTPYADVDGDKVPDLAVGRIAADSVEELDAALRKILRYEQSESGDWQRRLNVVAGGGGFGAMTDAIVEAAGRHVIQQTVPRNYEVRHTRAHAIHSRAAPVVPIRTHVRDQFTEGSLAWIYLGHGLPTELDCVPTANGREPILSVSDVPRLRCGSNGPLAVLVACYTGAFDAPRDCLGEELSLATDGPVAVIAATRVTMPYGNTVLGYELLRACFQDRQPLLGDVLLLAQQRTMRESAEDALRESLDAMCRGLSPPPVDLAAERGEHVLMYHLLGDPLLRLRRPPASLARAEAAAAITK